MPIFRNNDESQGRYCVHPDGHITFHEASQKTKGGYRECEESDLAAFPEHLLIHAGLKEAPPAEPTVLRSPPQVMNVKISASGTVTNPAPDDK